MAGLLQAARDLHYTLRTGLKKVDSKTKESAAFWWYSHSDLVHQAGGLISHLRNQAKALRPPSVAECPLACCATCYCQEEHITRSFPAHNHQRKSTVSLVLCAVCENLSHPSSCATCVLGSDVWTCLACNQEASDALQPELEKLRVQERRFAANQLTAPVDDDHPWAKVLMHTLRFCLGNMTSKLPNFHYAKAVLLKALEPGKLSVLVVSDHQHDEPTYPTDIYQQVYPRLPGLPAKRPCRELVFAFTERTAGQLPVVHMCAQVLLYTGSQAGHGRTARGQAQQAVADTPTAVLQLLDSTNYRVQGEDFSVEKTDCYCRTNKSMLLTAVVESIYCGLQVSGIQEVIQHVCAPTPNQPDYIFSEKYVLHPPDFAAAEGKGEATPSTSSRPELGQQSTQQPTTSTNAAQPPQGTNLGSTSSLESQSSSQPKSGYDRSYTVLDRRPQRQVQEQLCQWYGNVDCAAVKAHDFIEVLGSNAVRGNRHASRLTSLPGGNHILVISEAVSAAVRKNTSAWLTEEQWHDHVFDEAQQSLMVGKDTMFDRTAWKVQVAKLRPYAHGVEPALIAQLADPNAVPQRRTVFTEPLWLASVAMHQKLFFHNSPALELSWLALEKAYVRKLGQLGQLESKRTEAKMKELQDAARQVAQQQIAAALEHGARGVNTAAPSATATTAAAAWLPPAATPTTGTNITASTGLQQQAATASSQQPAKVVEHASCRQSKHDSQRTEVATTAAPSPVSVAAETLAEPRTRISSDTSAPVPTTTFTAKRLWKLQTCLPQGQQQDLDQAARVAPAPAASTASQSASALGRAARQKDADTNVDLTTTKHSKPARLRNSLENKFADAGQPAATAKSTHTSGRTVNRASQEVSPPRSLQQQSLAAAITPSSIPIPLARFTATISRRSTGPMQQNQQPQAATVAAATPAPVTSAATAPSNNATHVPPSPAAQQDVASPSSMTAAHPSQPTPNPRLWGVAVNSARKRIKQDHDGEGGQQ